jgi:hypothetical protein
MEVELTGLEDFRNPRKPNGGEVQIYFMGIIT